MPIQHSASRSRLPTKEAFSSQPRVRTVLRRRDKSRHRQVQAPRQPADRHPRGAARPRELGADCRGPRRPRASRGTPSTRASPSDWTPTPRPPPATWPACAPSADRPYRPDSRARSAASTRSRVWSLGRRLISQEAPATATPRRFEVRGARVPQGIGHWDELKSRGAASCLARPR